MSGLDGVLDVVLEDDHTMTGGTAFWGETVREFLLSFDQQITTIEELNAMLQYCGIKPVEANEKVVYLLIEELIQSDYTEPEYYSPAENSRTVIGVYSSMRKAKEAEQKIMPKIEALNKQEKCGRYSCHIDEYIVDDNLQN